MATIIGTDGNDILYGTDGADQFYGGAGDDTFLIDNDDTVVNGGAGEDSIFIQGTAGVTLDLGAL